MWHEDIINTCPYTKVETIELQQQGEILHNEDTLVQMVNMFKECNLIIHGTTNGMYVSLDPMAIKLKQSDTSINTEKSLIISDIDTHLFKSQTDELTQLRKIEREICSLRRHGMMQLIQTNKGYFKHQQAVILPLNGALFNSSCQNIDKIYIESAKPSTRCTPTANFQNTATKKAFLYENGLLLDNVMDSNTCEHKLIRIDVEREIQLEKLSTEWKLIFNRSRPNNQLNMATNFTHNKFLINYNVDVNSEIANAIQLDDNNQDQRTYESDLGEVKDRISNYNIFDILATHAKHLLAFIILATAVLLIYVIPKKICKSRKKKLQQKTATHMFQRIDNALQKI